MSKLKILVTAPLDFLPDLKEKINSETDLTYIYGEKIDGIAKLLSNKKFDAWLVSPCPTYFIDKDLIDLCKTVKIISTPSTGSNHIDVQYAKSKGIEIFSLKNSEVVEKIVASSEFTFNLMISTIRNTPLAYNSVKEGNWREIEAKFRGRELSELTLGIIGFGRIGNNLAKYANAFGMKIYSYDPYKTISLDYVSQFNELNEMLEQCDVISVCVHLNKETYKMVNRQLFEKMKDGVYFINTSRGDVVDEDALLEMLTNGKIKSAGLDVISGEYTTSIKEHKLIKYMKVNNNLIITPHIAGLTFDSERKAQTAAYNAIKEYLNKSEV